MGNTVGSQKELTQRQKNIIIGTILGDGTLELDGRNARLKLDHSEKQKDYLLWKHRELFNISSAFHFYSQKPDLRTKRKYKHCQFNTLSLESLNFYYGEFYKNGRKSLSYNIVRLLNNPLSLAVWFMDDGYQRSDCNALRLNTDCFIFEEQTLLIECLKRNFNVEARIHKKGRYWNIYIPSKYANFFCGIVEPYIIPQMRYKLI